MLAGQITGGRRQVVGGHRRQAVFAPALGRQRAAGTVAVELTALEQAEQAASDRLIGQLGGLPPSLAQLFASIAASDATHATALAAKGLG